MHPPSRPLVRVRALLAHYQASFRWPLRRFWFGWLSLGAGLVALVAREGSSSARLGAAALALLLFVPPLFLFWRSLGLQSRPAQALTRAVALVSKAKSEQLGRAYRLWQSEQDGGSAELKELHLLRSLESISEAELLSAFRRRARLWGRLGLVLCLGAGLGAMMAPVHFAEGWAVLLSRQGLSPFLVRYVESYELTATPPLYLRKDGQARLIRSEAITVPDGSLVSFRILPRVEGRQLVLTDGVRRIPFVPEGEHGYSAQILIEDPVSLRVGAKLGEVLVLDPLELNVFTSRDREPSVSLKGAPKTLSLGEFERIELEYSAKDDHGLSEIVLSVKTGQKEKRSELARLDGESLSYRGATALRRDHPLLVGAFLPVRVTVEARDRNPAPNAVWGKSAVIVLLPPPLGKEQASRHGAWLTFRSAVVRYFARDHRAQNLSGAEQRSELQAAQAELDAALGRLRSSLGGQSENSLKFAARQVEQLKQPTGSLEPALLALDALVAQLARQDALRIAEQLASAVDELVVLANQLEQSRQDAPALQSLQETLEQAERGAAELSHLGVLGLDLGSVAEADLGRARALRDQQNWEGVERVAKHLAGRLRRKTPSFSAKTEQARAGSGGSGGAGEAAEGSESGSGGKNETAEALDRLAQEHAEEQSELARLLKEAAEAARADRGSEGSREEGSESSASSGEARAQLKPERLNKLAERELNLSQRANQLIRRGAERGELSPEDAEALGKAAQKMSEAAAKLKAGEAAEGLRLSELAQAELERAQVGKEGSSGSAEGRDEGDSESERVAREGYVPEAREHLAEDFRRRVQQGLRGGGPRYERAVRRYAEDLQ